MSYVPPQMFILPAIALFLVLLVVYLNSRNSFLIVFLPLALPYSLMWLPLVFIKGRRNNLPPHMATRHVEWSLSILSWDWGHTVRSMEVRGCWSLFNTWVNLRTPTPSFLLPPPHSPKVVTFTPVISSGIHNLSRKKGKRRGIASHICPH